MAYATSAQIKYRLAISTSIYDTEITAIITSTDAIVDVKLQEYVSTPLASANQTLVDASNDLATAEFIRRRYPDQKERIKNFEEHAYKLIEDYIKESYHKAPLIEKSEYKAFDEDSGARPFEDRD